ncbi:DNA-processing protein DprA [Streptomyces sp. AC555_RSS877]|uniref:DNA-processing protein DprA n=1 Tax=Streptomyces sp. AC555_RSS877 TaxID=2823688 RepID=UPI001C2564FE|nr:DNA-processing protein DprA [Streptomyces sp. AC555_RSS877]
MSDRAALAALSAHFTPAEVAADLAQHSPVEVWAQRVRLDNTGRLSQYRPKTELSSGELTCRFLIPTDAQWPSALADLGPACPLGLWVRGHNHLPELTTSTVVVTGNRAPSPEAVERSTAFATAVAEAGYTVAASLAYGVDATAHEAAHLMGRPTLAVLPRGLDQAYPHNHGPLLNAITENGGAALSLYRPGTVTSGATLQASAALLAALSRAVILIEALDHAQALRTAEAAIDLKRTLLAVPSPSGIRAGGNTRLLAEHLALACPSPARALELL